MNELLHLCQINLETGCFLLSVNVESTVTNTSYWISQPFCRWPGNSCFVHMPKRKSGDGPGGKAKAIKSGTDSLSAKASSLKHIQIFEEWLPLGRHHSVELAAFDVIVFHHAPFLAACSKGRRP